jgi:hypothetical protein
VGQHRSDGECDCAECYASVAMLIWVTFLEYPRWMGAFQVRAGGMCATVSEPLYHRVFQDIVDAGYLLKIAPRSFNDFAVYLPSSMAGSHFEASDRTWALVPSLGRHCKCHPSDN